MKRFLTFLILSTAAFAAEPAQDSLDALRGLKSVTEVGINFRDYSKRVLDAKVTVDKYLAVTPKEDAQRTNIETIMRLHVMVTKAWAARVAPGNDPKGMLDTMAEIGDAMMNDPEISQCPGMKQFVENAMRPVGKITMEVRTLGFLVGQKPGILWRCAGTMLDR